MGAIRLIRLAGLLLAAIVLLRAASADDDARQRECELGITLALAGRAAAAESVFTSLLSHSPRDARALTNLGNLALLRGEPRLGLAFYAGRDSGTAPTPGSR